MNYKATFGGLLAAAALCIIPVAHATTNAVAINDLKVVAEHGDSHTVSVARHEEHRHHHHHRHEWWGKNTSTNKAGYPAPRS